MQCVGLELLSVKLEHRLILYLRPVCLSDSLLALISQTSVTPLSDCLALAPQRWVRVSSAMWRGQLC